MKIALGWLLGIAIWLGMTAQVTVLSVLNISVTVFGWAPYALLKGGELGAALARQAWPVIYVEALRPIAALTMPGWVALWARVSPALAYLLNTPDDPDPANQGWNGTNREPQVMWVRARCGAFWGRVYWLQRNCLYGLAVKSKPVAIDVAKAFYSFQEGWLCARWSDQVGVFDQVGAVTFDRLVVERITGLKVWPGRVLAFGADVHAYVDQLGPPLERNPRPETDPTKDTGGVPCVKLVRL